MGAEEEDCGDQRGETRIYLPGERKRRTDRSDYRAFCEPSIDSVVSIDPSYGMYEVAANVNNVEFKKIKLDGKFDLDTDSLLEAANDWVKVIFLCSPNNPTGNNLSRDRLYKVLNTFQGIVVIDEAYSDFSIEPSFLNELDKFPNLIVLQTMSKAWGAARNPIGDGFCFS